METWDKVRAAIGQARGDRAASRVPRRVPFGWAGWPRTEYRVPLEWSGMAQSRIAILMLEATREDTCGGGA